MRVKFDLGVADVVSFVPEVDMCNKIDENKHKIVTSPNASMPHPNFEILRAKLMKKNVK